MRAALFLSFVLCPDLEQLMIIIAETGFGLVFVIPRDFACRSSGFTCSVHFTRKVWDTLIDNDDIAAAPDWSVRIHILLWEASILISQAADNSGDPIPMPVVRQRKNAQILGADLRIWRPKDPSEPLTIALDDEAPAGT